MSKEIEYPIFKGGEWHFYKVISETEAIEVYLGYDDCRIQSYQAKGLNEKEITEALFLEKFYTVRKKLNKLCDINFDLL